MSNKLLRNLLWVSATVFAFLFSNNVSADTFTAIASGNWSASSTWAGGISPGTAVNNDQIVIASTFNVTLDQSVEVTGVLSSLQVDGDLTASNSSDLTITQGTLLGSGMVDVDELSLGAAALVTYTGEITVNSFSNAMTSLTLALDLTVNQTLELMGGVLTVGNGGALTLANNGTIVIDGGSISTSGTGAFTLSGNYNVNYTGSSTTAGLELSGSGLNNVSIQLSSAANAINLSSDATVNGLLTVNTGRLNIGANDLTLNGGILVMANGGIQGNGSSNIILTGGNGGSISFATGGQTVNNLTINLTSNATLELNSDLTVSGNLSNSSATLDISDVDLTVSGDLSGNGHIMANSNSSITLDGNASLSGGLNIMSSGSGSAATIGDLDIDLGGTNSVMLAGDLTVSGTLYLSSGSLSLNGNELTIAGNISATGSGSIMGSATSSITIMTNGNVVGDLELSSTGSGQVLENLTIDIDNNGSVSLGSNVTINGTLDLQSGNLNINGNTITVGTDAEIMLDADASVLGVGNFNGIAGYNLTVTGDGNVDINLFGTGTGMNDLTVNLDNGASASISSDLTVNGTLDLQGGSLDLNGYDLTLNGDVEGGINGSIMSDASSIVSVNSATSSTGGLNFASGANTLGSLNINVQDGGSVTINTDVMVENTLTFTSGSIMLEDGDLTINAGGSITGADEDSYVITMGQGSLEMDITASGSAEFAVGTENNYAPATIMLNGSGSGMFSVRVDDDVLSNGTTGSVSSDVHSVVDATWHVGSDMTIGMDIDLMVEWTSAMEVNGFNRDSAYISHYTGGSWDMDVTASATAEASGRFSLTRTGITSLSPFAVFDNDASVGILELAQLEDLTIYPNPAVSVVTIPSNANGATIQILDLNGATIMELNQDMNQALTVDVAGLSQGIYVVKVIGIESVATGRFVKN